MKKYLILIFLISSLIINSTTGQITDNSGGEPGEIYLRLKNINFLKNNEYFNPVIEGYTLIGYFLKPEIVYWPAENFNLRLGTHILKYAGTEKFSQIKPVFSASWNFIESTTLTVGSLEGCDKHKMSDPHFNSERLYNASYAEDGLQIKTTSNHFFNDAWISWENFIYKGDNTREVFTAGESFKYTSSPVSDLINFEIPVQIQFKHFGGQISNYPEHMETYFNLATGTRINFDIAEKKYGQAGFEYNLFLSNELTGHSSSSIGVGRGNWYRLHYTYKSIYFGAAYWKSHNFFAPNGNTIYSSISDYQNVIIANRRIITNWLSLTLLPESFFELFLGLETYYDIDLKRLDNAVTLHLNFDKFIKLATLKK
ncbi:MAG: hypothetical protein LLG13_03060 [Bacteroidales bacterium]|nr:hypothetical protein [Bacteroidales bacterium]